MWGERGRSDRVSKVIFRDFSTPSQFELCVGISPLEFSWIASRWLSKQHNRRVEKGFSKTRFFEQILTLLHPFCALKMGLDASRSSEPRSPLEYPAIRSSFGECFRFLYYRFDNNSQTELLRWKEAEKVLKSRTKKLPPLMHTEKVPTTIWVRSEIYANLELNIKEK